MHQPSFLLAWPLDQITEASDILGGFATLTLLAERLVSVSVQSFQIMEGGRRGLVPSLAWQSNVGAACNI